MRRIWRRILDEPAIATGIPTVLFATAAGVWNEPWLAFAAAASAGIGTLFVRTHSAPIHNGQGSELTAGRSTPHGRALCRVVLDNVQR